MLECIYNVHMYMGWIFVKKTNMC